MEMGVYKSLVESAIMTNRVNSCGYVAMTICQATVRTFSCDSSQQPWQAETSTRRQDVRKDLDDRAN